MKLSLMLAISVLSGASYGGIPVAQDCGQLNNSRFISDRDDSNECESGDCKTAREIQFSGQNEYYLRISDTVRTGTYVCNPTNGEIKLKPMGGGAVINGYYHSGRRVLVLLSAHPGGFIDPTWFHKY